MDPKDKYYQKTFDKLTKGATVNEMYRKLYELEKQEKYDSGVAAALFGEWEDEGRRGERAGTGSGVHPSPLPPLPQQSDMTATWMLLCATRARWAHSMWPLL